MTEEMSYNSSESIPACDALNMFLYQYFERKFPDIHRKAIHMKSIDPVLENLGKILDNGDYGRKITKEFYNFLVQLENSFQKWKKNNKQISQNELEYQSKCHWNVIIGSYLLLQEIYDQNALIPNTYKKLPKFVLEYAEQMCNTSHETWKDPELKYKILNQEKEKIYEYYIGAKFGGE